MATIQYCEELQRRIREHQNGILKTIEATKDCDCEDFAQYVRDVMDEDFAYLDRVYEDIEKTKLYLSKAVGDHPAP